MVSVYAVEMKFEYGHVYVHAVADQEIIDQILYDEYDAYIQACAEQTLKDAGWSTPFPDWMSVRWEYLWSVTNDGKEVQLDNPKGESVYPREEK